jgi:acyl-CoA hydrolase
MMQVARLVLFVFVAYLALLAIVNWPGRYDVTPMHGGRILMYVDTATGMIAFRDVDDELISRGMDAVPFRRRVWPW